MKLFARQLRLVTLLTVGLCGLAHAQTPDFSLPPLPALPTAAESPAGAIPLPPHDGSPKLPSLPTVTSEVNQLPVAAMPDAIPELADLPTPSVTLPKEEVAEAPAEAPEATEPPLNVAAPPTTLPGLDLPAPPSITPPMATSTGAPSLPSATLLPEVDVAVEAPRPARKTWQTTLKPSSVNVTTRFNYRRQVLPSDIYRPAYDPANRHLPTRVTAGDYDRELLAAVARNDVDATRAMLNTRQSINLASLQGADLLSVARQYRAGDTERLLLARGAR